MASSALRLRDLRAIHALVGECRELGDDPTVWRRHFFQGLARLASADLVMGGEMAGCRAGANRNLGTADWGWSNGFDRAGWLRAVAENDRDPAYSPIMNAYLPRLAAEDGVCLSRAQILTDREWYPSGFYQAIHRTVGVDATLQCFRSIPGTADEHSGIILSRAAGGRDFAARDRAIVREAHACVAALVGGPLARFTEPSPADLAPRVRQVLRCLLEGDSDKQAAARLGLTRNTVNQYAKHVFRHFRVTTRAELLARWVRRGWNGRCAWADE